MPLLQEDSERKITIVWHKDIKEAGGIAGVDVDLQTGDATIHYDDGTSEHAEIATFQHGPEGTYIVARTPRFPHLVITQSGTLPPVAWNYDDLPFPEYMMETPLPEELPPEEVTP